MFGPKVPADFPLLSVPRFSKEPKRLLLAPNLPSHTLSVVSERDEG